MTHEELRDILNAEVPSGTPDPDWDYYQLWENLMKAKNKLEELIRFVSKQEEASSDADTLIKGKLFSLECDFEGMKNYVSQ